MNKFVKKFKFYNKDTIKCSKIVYIIYYYDFINSILLYIYFRYLYPLQFIGGVMYLCILFIV